MYTHKYTFFNNQESANQAKNLWNIIQWWLKINAAIDKCLFPLISRGSCRNGFAMKTNFNPNAGGTDQTRLGEGRGWPFARNWQLRRRPQGDPSRPLDATFPRVPPRLLHTHLLGGRSPLLPWIQSSPLRSQHPNQCLHIRVLSQYSGSKLNTHWRSLIGCFVQTRHV